LKTCYQNNPVIDITVNDQNKLICKTLNPDKPKLVYNKDTSDNCRNVYYDNDNLNITFKKDDSYIFIDVPTNLTESLLNNSIK
jgi:hypothetical protein